MNEEINELRARIAEWKSRGLDKEGIALCPNCGIDSALPEKPSVDLTMGLLEEMHQFWF